MMPLADGGPRSSTFLHRRTFMLRRRRQEEPPVLPTLLTSLRLVVEEDVIGSRFDAQSHARLPSLPPSSSLSLHLPPCLSSIGACPVPCPRLDLGFDCFSRIPPLPSVPSMISRSSDDAVFRSQSCPFHLPYARRVLPRASDEDTRKAEDEVDRGGEAWQGGGDRAGGDVREREGEAGIEDRSRSRSRSRRRIFNVESAEPAAARDRDREGPIPSILSLLNIPAPSAIWRQRIDRYCCDARVLQMLPPPADAR
ncbi:hypothetical protein C8Q70DRAFT_386112 [Cubamyces menziesii]|nr:hypothetical protein C8Q70DRAFT_386112 [Cubamyces menziesii]